MCLPPPLHRYASRCFAPLTHAPHTHARALAGLLTSEPAADAKPAKRWGRSRPYLSRVVALEPLCTLSSADDKNTVRAEFDMGDSGMAYLPGDALGIYPFNAPQVGVWGRRLPAMSCGPHAGCAA